MQTPKHSSRARRGLSLVEATISMVIVSVVIAGRTSRPRRRIDQRARRDTRAPGPQPRADAPRRDPAVPVRRAGGRCDPRLRAGGRGHRQPVHLGRCGRLPRLL
ncbi:MAG: prepilin-type N-terminal cleavage/methylation domain-containing protein [Planctomycetota bacterium]|nr:MAG: prepilin-type N-terminal cleavage/methylation domain-containing protein [Planctomycetota bacterium]